MAYPQHNIIATYIGKDSNKFFKQGITYSVTVQYREGWNSSILVIYKDKSTYSSTFYSSIIEFLTSWTDIATVIPINYTKEEPTKQETTTKEKIVYLDPDYKPSNQKQVLPIGSWICPYCGTLNKNSSSLFQCSYCKQFKDESNK